MVGRQRMHLIIRGRVQGVYFRGYTMDMARQFNVKGWVRNLSDGTVEVVAEGQRKNLDKLKEWCHKGPPSAHVTTVMVNYETATGEFEGFAIRY